MTRKLGRAGLVAAALTLGLVVMGAPNANAAPRCFGKAATIVGTRRNDQIRGTAGNDVIVGGRGGDFIDGRGGRDLICGGVGNDTLLGFRGADKINGQKGHDLIAGEHHDDRLIGGPGNDEIHGGPGEDVIRGNAGFNFLLGGRGNDLIVGANGIDFLWGQQGNDNLKGGGGIVDRALYSFATSSVVVNLATGTASGGGEGNDTLSGVEDVQGSGFSDTLTGDAQANWFFPMEGNDDVAGGTQPDDPGNADLVSMDLATGEVTGNLGTGTMTDAGAEGHGTDVLTGIEGMQSGEFKDTLTGDANQNLLISNRATDDLSGGDDDDILDGGGSNNDTGDGGNHVTEDVCISIENASNCEFSPARPTRLAALSTDAGRTAALSRDAGRMAAAAVSGVAPNYPSRG